MVIVGSIMYIYYLMLTLTKIGVFRNVKKIKGYTSRKLKEEFPELTKKKVANLMDKFNSKKGHILSQSVGIVTLEVVKKEIY